MSRPVAKLVPVRMEIGASRNGRPGYRWVEGYQLVTPEGDKLYPYFRKAEARKRCRDEGWEAQVEEA